MYAKATRIREIEEGQCQSEGAGEGGGQVQKGARRLSNAGGQVHGHTKRLRGKNDSSLQGTNSGLKTLEVKLREINIAAWAINEAY